MQITKSAFNIREALNSLKKRTGLFGEQVIRAETVDDFYNVIGTNRNLIINGDFKIWQRATSFSYTLLAAAPFMADRFWAYNGSSSTGTFERSSDVPLGQPFNYSFHNNTNSSARIGTNVELYSQGLPAPFVLGKTYTLSFWIKGTTPGAATLSLTWRNEHANGASEVILANGVPYAWSTAWQQFTYTFPITNLPNGSNRVFDIELSLDIGAKITGMQLEQGAVVTPFEQRPIGAELALCQRYYFVYESKRSLACVFNNTGLQAPPIAFPVQMRAAPTGAGLTAPNITTVGNWGVYGATNGWGSVAGITPTFSPTPDASAVSLGAGGLTNGSAYLVEGGATFTSEL